MRGIGDVIANGLHKIGIKPCGGCERRRQTLNRWTPGYRQPRKPVLQNTTRQLLTFADGPVRSRRSKIPRMSYPGKPVGAWFPFSSYPISGGSQTINANSAAQADILTAIGQAADGDTVLVPVDIQDWTGTIELDKRITLMGAGNVTVPGARTYITDLRVENPSGERWVIRNYGLGGTGVFRITGFAFNSGPNGNEVSTLSDGFIQLGGCSINNANFRIDNNRFNQIQNDDVRTFGHVYGVVDHNIVIVTVNTHISTSVYDQGWPRDGVNCGANDAGDGSMAAPLPLTSGQTGQSTIRAVYIEDNTYNGINTAAANSMGTATDSSEGGRYVFRRNTLNHVVTGSHGTDGHRGRGSRWIENYDNTFNFLNADPAAAGIDSLFWLRGGTGVFYNNTANIDQQTFTFGFNWYIKYTNRRDIFDQNSGTLPGTGLCDGSSPWDGGSNSTGFSDTPTGYRCIDQPGSGTSIDANGVNPWPSTLQADNILDPIYVWNNTVNGVAQNSGNPGEISDNHVVVDRDIIFDTARPGYSPFQYPHPLVGSALPPRPTYPLRNRSRV